MNCSKYPILSQAAKDVLVIPMSIIVLEFAFSPSDCVVDSFQNFLTPKLVEALLCAQDWLQALPLPINVEKSMTELEQLESGNTNEFIFIC